MTTPVNELCVASDGSSRHKWVPEWKYKKRPYTWHCAKCGEIQVKPEIGPEDEEE